MRAGPPPCRCCKDIDEALGKHGDSAVRGWLTDLAPAALSLDGEARKCARIKDPLRRGQAIKEVVDRHALRGQGLTKAFRDQVVKHGGRHDEDDENADAVAGAEVVHEDVLAWPHPVDGTVLLDEIDVALQRHVACAAEDRTLGILWAIHNYRRYHKHVGTLPRLIITAGREDSGKTHYGKALVYLSEHGVLLTQPTAPNIYRAPGAPVFVLDEVDEWYGRESGMQEVINAGFNDDSVVLRQEDVGKGGRRKLETRQFSTFIPLCLIGIDLERLLRRTVLSRALIVRLRPARASDAIEDLYDNPPARLHLGTIGRRIKRWVADNETALVSATPERPTGVINRLWGIWRPLLAIADLAGGKWPARARQALEVARTRGTDPGLGVQLLGDVYEILQRTPGRRMHTGDLIAELLKLELRSWGYFGKARVPLRDTDVAALLGPYELHPQQLKISGRNRNGYRLEDVAAAVERYAPSLLSEVAANSLYLSTDSLKPNGAAGFGGRPPVEGRPYPSTAAEGVDPTENPASTDFSEENQSGRQVDPPGGGSEETHNGGDGADPAPRMRRTRPPKRKPAPAPNGEVEDMITGAHAGTRCARCHAVFRAGDQAAEINGKIYHADDACVGEIRRRGQITGADTEPSVERLPPKGPVQ
jgi:hypothetical protein